MLSTMSQCVFDVLLTHKNQIMAVGLISFQAFQVLQENLRINQLPCRTKKNFITEPRSSELYFSQSRALSSCEYCEQLQKKRERR